MNRTIQVDYVNWKGERAMRRITPFSLFWGSTEFHPEPQWLLAAMDEETRAERTFALSGIRGTPNQMIFDLRAY